MAEPKEKPSEEVRIRRNKIMVPTADGGTDAIVYITYTTSDLPPGLVQIPEKEWTEEKEAELVRASIKARRETKPSIIRL